MADVAPADAIEALRRQLTEAVDAGQGQPVRFAVSGLELKLSITVTKDIEGHAGIRFWVVDAGGGGYSEGAVQQVTLQLLPVDAAGQPIPLADSSSLRPV